MFELLFALSGPWPPSAAPPRLPVAVVVVSLDNATQGQIRYGRSTVEAAGGEYGAFVFTPPPLEETAFQACLDDELERAVTCARFYIGHNNARETRPPVVVVLLSDAGDDDEFKPGQLQVACVGVGEAATNAERQTIRLWPNAIRMHGVNDMMEDRNALTGCIAAAGAESGW